ncbi:MAG: hypothetical protein A2Y25_01465 [Candidatus Melainabacteria bacterium GWF2_37_15]|nr:MAG: hypothetical protein A2Y25_01465 [Candidatus Melainabacteria bacterium GWF2_37_15]
MLNTNYACNTTCNNKNNNVYFKADLPHKERMEVMRKLQNLPSMFDVQKVAIDIGFDPDNILAPSTSDSYNKRCFAVELTTYSNHRGMDTQLKDAVNKVQTEAQERNKILKEDLTKVVNSTDQLGLRAPTIQFLSQTLGNLEK